MTTSEAPAAPSRDAFIASKSPIERELRQLFPSLDARVVFDIGSCEGEDAIRYSKLFPDARVYAFEPVPDNVRLLREHVDRWAPSRIEVRELALSDQPGTATLHVSSGHPPTAPVSDWDYGNKSSSLLAPDRHVEIHPWVRFDNTITVSTDTIARVMEAEGLDRIDLVHLDVQGAELRVLAGAGPFLDRIGAIWMEVEAIPLYTGQPLKNDVERFMADHGFRLMRSTVKKVSGDQLYVNPRVLESAGARALSAASPRRNGWKALLRRVPGVRPMVRWIRRRSMPGEIGR